MLKTKEKIKLLSELSKIILTNEDVRLKAAIQKSYVENKWFTHEEVKFVLRSIAKQYLNPESLNQLAADYSIKESEVHKTVGLIPAGNIPLVGFHDMLCVFLCDHFCQIKSSQKDKYLAAALVDILIGLDERVKSYFSFVEKLKDFDAVIATGSDNTSRYFEYYFKDYPHVIRRNRTGIAVLSGTESQETLVRLADDVFRYFGLGCRNVSKIYIPKSFDLKQLFPLWKSYDHYIQHNKYANNFEYNSANLILSQQEFLTNNVFILKEDDALVSRISTVHYSYYENLDILVNQLKEQRDSIQCISTELDISEFPTVPIGYAQQPSITDFADGVDTINFLLDL